jgi:hypothetical protein
LVPPMSTPIASGGSAAILAMLRRVVVPRAVSLRLSS